MIEIGTYSACDKDEVIALVLHCQNDGTRPLVSIEDQPELLRIEEEYIDGGGNFWVAKENGKVAGTIGLMNKGNGLCILKKFFVYEPYRGKPHHLGRQLYALFWNLPIHKVSQKSFSTHPRIRTGRICFMKKPDSRK